MIERKGLASDVASTELKRSFHFQLVTICNQLISIGVQIVPHLRFNSENNW